MISRHNPFPGMNPFFEARWPDVHTALIGYLRDAIATQLPAGLIARAEESVAVDAWEDKPSYRSDVLVAESWRQGIPPKWSPEAGDQVGDTLVAMPEIIRLEPLTERWLELRTPEGKVVTVIELLSPANKIGDGRLRYIRKQFDYLNTDVNLVVIDLIRTGESVLSVPPVALATRPLLAYNICTALGHDPETRELYRIGLRQRLPIIRIPLRTSDTPVQVDLQPLIDRCYEMGGYWQADYSADPEPPLDEADRAWLDERLREAGLR